MKLQNGQTVDRYTVEALIGSGGTAMVYRVRHTHLGTFHALKVLTLSSAAIRQRMLREGQVQASLRHLNVVAVNDVIDIDGAPGLLMEYIEGPSLERALGEFRLTMGDAEVLFQGIVAGVRQAHRSGLVHRDLKPANVLLAKTTQGFVPKVTDFGLAKVIQSDPQIGHTRSGIAMGTPSYMAPEQIRDARTVDQRADLWSLGCILYELVTRYRAFPGEEALPIYNAVIGGEYVPPRERVEDLPDRLDQAIRGCLTVARSDRIPDCDTLMEVLRGERTWEIREGAEPAPPTVEIPNISHPLRSDVPDLPVAARKPDGGTPAPAPRRAAAGGGRVPSEDTTRGGIGLVPLAEVRGKDLRSVDPETVVLRSPVDGTLDASDSFAVPEEAPAEEEGRSWVHMALLSGMLLVVGGLALLMAVTVLGSLMMVDRQLGSAVLAPGTEETAVSPETPAPDGPGEGEDDGTSDEPADPQPEPEERPAPAPQAKPRPSARVAPAPRPAPKAAPAEPAAPERVEVKVLSVPPTATLRIDGRASGRTPAKLDLTAGRHVVSVQSGERYGEFTVQVDPEAENKWCFAFGEIGPAGAGAVHEGSCP